MAPSPAHEREEDGIQVKEDAQADQNDLDTVEGWIVDTESSADYVQVIPESVPVEYYDGGLALTGYDGEISVGDTFAVYYQNLAYTYIAGSVERVDGDLYIDTERAPDSAVVSGEFSGGIQTELIADWQ